MHEPVRKEPGRLRRERRAAGKGARGRTPFVEGHVPYSECPPCPARAHRFTFARLVSDLRSNRKELQAAARENGDWAGYYLDYKALKQILGQLTPPALDAQTESNAQVRSAAVGALGCQG